MLNYIKIGLTKPKDSFAGMKMNKKQSIGYFFVLALLFFLPVLRLILPLYGQAREDTQEIAENIPEFIVEDGALSSESDSYIHLTDTFIFFFDPNDTISDSLINQNLNLYPPSIGIALLKDEMSFNVNGSSQSLSYTELGNFDQTVIQSLFYERSNSSGFTLIIVSIILFFITALVYLFEFLPTVIIAYMISLFSRFKIRFGYTSKIVLLASTLPVLLLSIINLLGFSSLYDIELRMIFTLIIFAMSLNELKTKT